MIVWVNVVLNRTFVVDSDRRFDDLCGSHLQSQSDLYQLYPLYPTEELQDIARPGGGGTPIHYPYGYVPPNGVVI